MKKYSRFHFFLSQFSWLGILWLCFLVTLTGVLATLQPFPYENWILGGVTIFTVGFFIKIISGAYIRSSRNLYLAFLVREKHLFLREQVKLLKSRKKMLQELSSLEKMDDEQDALLDKLMHGIDKINKLA